MSRVGIFGGAFNPPHKEHIRISTEAIQELGLSKIIFVPSGNSPHKEIGAPFDARVAMLKSLIDGNDKLDIDIIESMYAGKSYTVNILLELKHKYDDIVFIMGGDSLISFHTWHRPRQIVTICPIAVIPRGEIVSPVTELACTYNENWGANITVLKTRGEDISSSITRAMVALNMDTSLIISEECRKLIEKLGLYRNYDKIINKVKNSLSPKKWKHVCGVVLTGLRVNQQLNLPTEKVFLSCLLHDCMKESNIVHNGVLFDTLGTPVMHAFNGAVEAKQNYGVDDDEIIEAIRYHTTGRTNMSRLEKLVYVADMIEPNRHFSGVEELRKLVYNDFNTGFSACVETSYNHLAESGKDIYYLTVDCYNRYCKGV